MTAIASIGLAFDGNRETLVFGFDSIAEMLETSCEELLVLDRSHPKHLSIPHKWHGRFLEACASTLSSSLWRKVCCDWAIYVRADHPVGFELGTTVPVPVVSSYDYARRRHYRALQHLW